MSYGQSSHTEDSSDNVEESLRSHRAESMEVVERLQRTHGDVATPELFVSPEKLLPVIKQMNHAFSSMSFENARKHIETNISTTPVSDVAYKFPKIVDFITHLLRHDKALSGIAEMFKDKSKLFYFFIANVLTVVLGFILRKLMSKKVGIFKRILRWFSRKIFIYGLRIFILIFFYGSELEPTYNIFKEVFL